MPIRSKGARLYLRRATSKERSSWIIRDGVKSIRLGLAPDERGAAEEKLAAYLTDKYTPDRQRGRDPSQIGIADVLNIYLTDKGHTFGRPHEVAQRVVTLGRFFGDKRLDAINGMLCRAYVKARGSDAAAKRELEDLRAAINYHRKEGFCSSVIEVFIPPKADPRDRWLTRAEAARLIWAAWRYRETQKGQRTGRRSRQHVARFVLLALYTGTRSGAIGAASLLPAIGRSHVDLDHGMFYRQTRGRRTTKKRQPPIQLPGRMLAHLRRWQRIGVSSAAVIEFGGEPVARVTKAFSRACEDAGLGADVTPHTLRHTAVTWAMQNGADLWDAAAFFGMTVETLERVYGHHRPGAGASVALAIQAKR